MEAKAFKLGIIVGRFQTFHSGHEYMISKALSVCERVGVFVGSSQESRTAKNPYTYEERRSILRTVFDDRIDVYPLPDIGVGNNSRWGDYVLENVKRRCGQAPDLLVSGKEQRRISWFNGADGEGIAELYVPKIIDISATQMRGFMLEGDLESYKKFTPSRLWKDFERLREIVISSMENIETSSI